MCVTEKGRVASPFQPTLLVVNPTINVMNRISFLSFLFFFLLIY